MCVNRFLGHFQPDERRPTLWEIETGSLNQVVASGGSPDASPRSFSRSAAAQTAVDVINPSLPDDLLFYYVSTNRTLCLHPGWQVAELDSRHTSHVLSLEERNPCLCLSSPAVECSHVSTCNQLRPHTMSLLLQIKFLSSPCVFPRRHVFSTSITVDPKSCRGHSRRRSSAFKADVV